MTQAICGMPAADMRRLVEEDAAEMLAVGKHLGLVRQVGAAGIDQIDAGQPVLARDLLRAEMLLHRHRIVGAALHRGVVADDHDEPAGDAADAGDEAGAVDRLAVHAVRGERRQLEKGRARVEQPGDALARQQLAAREMALARPLRAAERGLGAAEPIVGDQRAHAAALSGDGAGSSVVGLDLGHGEVLLVQPPA